MKKFFTEFMNFASHNTGFLLSFIVSIVLTVILFSCTPTARSILDPTVQMTREELTIEADRLIATIDLRFKEIQKKEDFQEAVFEHAIAWTKTGTINPVGLITTFMAIAGIGATVDNVTKRRREGNALKTYVADMKKNNAT